MTGNIRDLVQIFQSQNRTWDQEWLQYFIESNPKVYFLSHKDLSLVGDIRGKSPLEVHNTELVTSAKLGGFGPIRVWIDGDNLLGKKVLEIGCGAGYSGKQIGLLASSYVGIDYSQLALSIARLTSPENCEYFHIADLDHLKEFEGTMDVMISRDFFIHQNFANVIPILRLGSYLLKPGGTISADFWLTRPYGYQPVTHPAKSELDPLYPSCAFLFSMNDIQEAAAETGLTMETITDISDWRRRFVTFRKQGAVKTAPVHKELSLPDLPANSVPATPNTANSRLSKIRFGLAKVLRKAADTISGS